MTTKTIGGDRLGSGKKMKVDMHHYERSNNNMGYLWRSTMSAGTLVPFMCEIALPNDTFNIDLECIVKTHPTIGPLFGSYKVQLDIFQAPIRLYQGQLHNSKLGIGLKMANVKLPLIRLTSTPVDEANFPDDVDNFQINPSCILAYLGIRGVGIHKDGAPGTRLFNGIPILAYWDIYKNYYANKQEEIGAVIHTPATTNPQIVTQIIVGGNVLSQAPAIDPTVVTSGNQISVSTTGGTQPPEFIRFTRPDGSSYGLLEIADLIQDTGAAQIYQYKYGQFGTQTLLNWFYTDARAALAGPIQVQTFPLEEIDQMREKILAETMTPTAFLINNAGGAPDVSLAPWTFLLQSTANYSAMVQSQEGLGLKTYQSDIFNNWIQTEWIDGAGGINEVTTIDTSGGGFTIDTLQLTKKVYDMLNRIAISGGSYKDYLEAVWDVDNKWICETPMYMGGLIKELVFQEVVSQAESPLENEGSQPLGTLAGKGIMANKHKGGSVTIKVDEPSYILGIISLTPRIDYSQGNRWHVHLTTMDDLHKPALDQIGFQESINEERAWWSTTQEVDGTWVQTSAGKLPAWMNYRTNFNRTYGNFAIATNEMFMTLNRKFTPVFEDLQYNIDDLTTYIDPAKYNNIFAQTSLDSQNFWVQIAVDMEVRRKISQRLLPNL